MEISVMSFWFENSSAVSLRNDSRLPVVTKHIMNDRSENCTNELKTKTAKFWIGPCAIGISLCGAEFFREKYFNFEPFLNTEMV